MNPVLQVYGSLLNVHISVHVCVHVCACFKHKKQKTNKISSDKNLSPLRFCECHYPVTNGSRSSWHVTDDKFHTLRHARTQVRVGTEACDPFLCCCLVLAVPLNVKIRWDAMAATGHFNDLGQFDQDVWIPRGSVWSPALCYSDTHSALSPAWLQLGQTKHHVEFNKSWNEQLTECVY